MSENVGSNVGIGNTFNEAYKNMTEKAVNPMPDTVIKASSNQYLYTVPSTPQVAPERKIAYLVSVWLRSDGDDDCFNAMKKAVTEWEKQEFGV